MVSYVMKTKNNNTFLEHKVFRESLYQKIVAG